MYIIYIIYADAWNALQTYRRITGNKILCYCHASTASTSCSTMVHRDGQTDRQTRIIASLPIKAARHDTCMHIGLYDVLTILRICTVSSSTTWVIIPVRLVHY